MPRNDEAERLHDLLRKLNQELESAREEDRIVASSLAEQAKYHSGRSKAAGAASDAARVRANDRLQRTMKRIGRTVR
jgi:hypothetical protein